MNKWLFFADTRIMKKSLFYFFVVFLFCNTLFGQISFGNIDLNDKDEILFTIENSSAHINPYRALATCKIKNGSSEKNPTLLSYYPERMELTAAKSGDENNRILQIRNAYGQAFYDIQADSFTWENQYQVIPENPLPLLPYSYSNDGKYYCYLEKTSFISAKLILKSQESGASKVLCQNLQISYDSVPVKWSIQGNVLLYEKDDNIYFCNPEALIKGIEIDEEYRLIGPGSINSVEFTDSKYFAYINDYLMYKINTKELYTMGIYSEIIGQGTVVGRLPFKFNSKTDKFSVNKELNSVFIVQNQRMFSYLTAHQDSCDYMDIIYSRPYTDSTASLVNSYVFWDKTGYPVLWLEKLPYNEDVIRCSAYRISNVASQLFEIEDSGKPYLSPDKSKLAFYAGQTAYVYDISNWNRIAELSGERIISLVWYDSRTIYAGGVKSIRKWNPTVNYSNVIGLSSVQSAYWNGKDNNIIADNASGNMYELDNVKNTWRKIGLVSEHESSTQNGRYRVFTGTSSNYNYKNALYIRTLGKKPITKAVYKETGKKFAPKNKVALVFDAYDNADGLAKVITTLKKYKVPGNFFINGEFIRRYPSETKQIVANGFNCNSMFFSQTNLTKNSFVINEDFIVRGLARNEDEFFNCTGSEFSIYWHAPYYKVNDDIILYSQNAGYTYVDTNMESFDFSIQNPKILVQEYYDNIVKNKGGIIPISIGFSQSTNDDSLYNYLDLLIFALFEGGFEITGINNL